MASIERTAYPRFPRTLTLKDLQASFTPRPEEIEWAQGFARTAERRLALLVNLKCFQYLRHFPAVEAVPAEVVEHVSACLGMAPVQRISYPAAHTALYRHHKVIRTLLGIKPYTDAQTRLVATRLAEEAAGVVDTRVDIINMNEHDFSRLPPDAQAYIRELEARAATNAQHIAELTERIKLLEEQFRLAQSKRFAPSSEKLKDRVFDEAEQMAATALSDDEDDAFALPDTGLPEPDRPAGGKRGRKPLPAELPRQRIEYDLTEDQKICPCCQGSMHRMGEEVSEQLHIEAKVSVLQHVRFKYACRHCDRNAERTPVLTAPMPAQPLPGSNASPAMLATVTIGKYVDGTPLYRMEDALGRAGIGVGRGTLANWIIRPAQLHYSRLYEALRRTLLSQPLIHADETTVQVLKEEGKTAQSKSYMWVYRSAEDCEHPVVLFDYQPGRGQEYPQAFLAGYEGMLMTDGYSAWRTLEGVTHFGCLAHSRRMFVDAQKGQKKPSARVGKALEYFKALYQVETLAKEDLPDGETRANYTYRLRQQHSVPLLKAFKAWLDEQAPQVLPESLLGKAIVYTRNQWEYLSRYAIDGRAPVDNNAVERDIRPFCTGRKAWLFADTVAGAKASAMIYSLMLTCRACDVEPYAYLLHVLTELPKRTPDADISDLLPFNFAPPHPA